MTAPAWANRIVDAALEVSVAGSFSRIGIETRSRIADWSDIADMSGKVVIVTGATSGIGNAAARAFSEAGADVVIVGRDQGRLDDAAATIGEVETALADLSDLDQARQFVSELTASHDRLDVLVHNAGALVAEYRANPQGFEDTYASQVLSQHILTAGLLPLLQRSSGRVITVSSGGMYSVGLDPDTVEMSEADFDGVRAYALAKRAQVTLNEQWAQRFGDSVTFQAMHPGWADTPGVRTSLPTFHRITGPFLRSPEQGADTIVWLGANPEAVASNGGFWHDRRPRSTTRLPTTRPDRDTADMLWDQVCRQTGVRP